MRAEKVNPKNYKYQPKEVIIPDSLYWGCIFYEDNTYCEFPLDKNDTGYRTQDINISYWGIYTVQTNMIKAQSISPSWNGGGVAEVDYHIVGKNLVSYKWVNFKGAGLGRYQKKDIFYDVPQVYRFIPSSNIPPPDSWLKKEKWMYE